jgi:hypothetical protein
MWPSRGGTATPVRIRVGKKKSKNQMGGRPPTACTRGGRATPREPHCGPLRVACMLWVVGHPFDFFDFFFFTYPDSKRGLPHYH